MNLANTLKKVGICCFQFENDSNRFRLKIHPIDLISLFNLTWKVTAIYFVLQCNQSWIMSIFVQLIINMFYLRENINHFCFADFVKVQLVFQTFLPHFAGNTFTFHQLALLCSHSSSICSVNFVLKTQVSFSAVPSLVSKPNESSSYRQQDGTLPLSPTNSNQNNYIFNPIWSMILF